MHSPSPPAAETRGETISCDTCEGVCCRLTVVLMAEDRIPAWLVETDERGLRVMARDGDGRCRALDPRSSRCTIYTQRPQVCRKFAMGGPYCRAERDAWFGTRPTAIPITLR